MLTIKHYYEYAQHSSNPITQFVGFIEKNEVSLLGNLHYFQVLEGLGFLHNDAKLVHGNIHPSSILINDKKIWKLSGFDFYLPNCSTSTDSVSKVLLFNPNGFLVSSSKKSKNSSLQMITVLMKIAKVFNKPIWISRPSLQIMSIFNRNSISHVYWKILCYTVSLDRLLTSHRCIIVS